MIRRSVRIVIAGVCALSLLACVANTLLWCRSHRRANAWPFHVHGVRYTVRSARSSGLRSAKCARSGDWLPACRTTT